MRSAWLVLLAALIATTPARACGPPYPAVPPEVEVAPFIGPTWDTYRCAEGPVTNFYQGAYYRRGAAGTLSRSRLRVPAVLPLQRLPQAAASILLHHGLALPRRHGRTASDGYPGSYVSFLT
jgi:hypothetical protein